MNPSSRYSDAKLEIVFVLWVRIAERGYATKLYYAGLFVEILIKNQERKQTAQYLVAFQNFASTSFLFFYWVFALLFIVCLFFQTA